MRCASDGASIAALPSMSTTTTLGGLDRPTAHGPRFLLACHHDELDAACAELRAKAYADDPRALIEQARAFERAMIAHLDAEEEHILPAYAAFDPGDARTIREQHAELRSRLMQLVIDAELHCICMARIDDMIAALRAHAAEEDRRMYPWARLHLPLRARRALFVRIGRSLGELARRRA